MWIRTPMANCRLCSGHIGFTARGVHSTACQIADVLEALKDSGGLVERIYNTEGDPKFARYIHQDLKKPQAQGTELEEIWHETAHDPGVGPLPYGRTRFWMELAHKSVAMNMSLVKEAEE